VNPRSLALLSLAYTSPMLLNTLLREGIPVAAKGPLRAELARHCPGLKMAAKEEAQEIISQPDSRILANAEGLLPCLLSASADSSRREGIRMLKTKPSLRERTGGLGPGTYSQVVEGCRLKEVRLPKDLSFIIKPSVGLQGIGLRKVNRPSDLAAIADDILQETRKAEERFGTDLISADRFSIEEYVKGEELACDAYMSSTGEPAILGVYAHPRLNDDDLRDVLFYTSSELTRKMLPRMEDSLRRIAELTGIRSLPMHAKFRRRGRELVPIEVNPMRFGDFGLPDLTFFAFGINPYRHYYQQQAPQWDRILSRPGKDIFFRVLARLPGSFSKKKFDHEKFADTFEDLAGYCRLDPLRHPAISIAFAKAASEEAALKYLKADFQEFFS